MHTILVGLAVFGGLTIAALVLYAYLKRRQILKAEQDTADHLKQIASKL